jgi:hypothetical protein
VLTGHAKTSKNIRVFNMNDDQKGFVCGMTLLSFICGTMLSWIITTNIYQDHAIKAGVGHYDRQTGTFKYKTLEGDVKAEEAK